MGARDGPQPAVDLPGHDRDPRDRPGDGRPAGRRHRPGPVGPHPRAVRRALDAVRDGRAAGRERRQHRRELRRRGRVAGHLRHPQVAHGAGRRRSGSGASCCSRATALVERVFLLVMVVFLAYPIAAVLSTEDWQPVFHAMVTPDVASLDTPLAAAAGRRRRHDDHALHAVLPAVRGRREGHRRGGAAARAGRRRRGLGLDQRDRDLHRRRDGRRGRRRRAAAVDHVGGGRGAGPRARRRAGSPRRCSASGCSGRPCSRRRSCRSRPRS